jgi:hypothetical protein
MIATSGNETPIRGLAVMADVDELKAEAENCRRLAPEADGLTMRLLLELAEQYEAEARLKAAYPKIPESIPTG